MASKKPMVTKDGKRYWKISVSRGYGLTPYTMNWYRPDGWSDKATMRELERVAGEFETRCHDGEVKNRAEIKAEQDAAAAEAAKLKTVRQYAENVFLPAKKVSMSRNGIASYKMFFDQHILPKLGDCLMTEVTPAMLMKRLLDFQQEGTKGHAHASCVKLYNILNGIFQMAFMDDTVAINPMLKVKRPVQSKDERSKDEEDKALTADQVTRLLEIMESEPLKWRVYVTLAIDTGMRRGELCGLHWSDIDMKNGIVTVRHNLQYAKGEVYETSCKNGKTRKIDIGPDTVEMLKQYRKDQSGKCVSKYVFTVDGSASPMYPTSPTRYFTVIGNKCGIPHFHPHMLRHTSASLSITNGGDVVSVSARLGHSDTAVTLRMYAHANEESIRKAGQAARDAIKKARKEG
ncbi:MAG: site-specific integrase [Clostridia bacterium]|nr:site-specific integrase [Clostridia bacterium]